METRALREIAREIRGDWKNPNYGAVPYLQAMSTMERVDDMYGYEYGDMVVAYFLSNATTWRGETARRVKAELKAMLADFNKRRH